MRQAFRGASARALPVVLAAAAAAALPARFAAGADALPIQGGPGPGALAAPATAMATSVPSLAGALRALHGGNPERAAEDFVRIRTAGGFGEPAEGHYLVGRAWLESAKPHYAVVPLGQAARSYEPLQDYALFHLGEAYLQLDRGASAVETFERLLVDFPGSVLVGRARLRLADALAADKRWDRAIATYEKVMEGGGSGGVSRADLLERIADCHEKRGDVGPAVDAWTKVWRDHPESAAARVAEARLNAHEAAGAPVASRASAGVRWSRALALSEAGKHGEALSEIDKLVAAKAKLPADWRLQRGLVLFRKRDYPAARKELERALTGLPAGPLRAETMFWLARSQARLDDYDSAHTTYAKLRRQYPQNKWAREGLFKQGLMALEDKSFDRAAGFFESYARTYASAGDADEAVWYQAWSQLRGRKYAAAETTLRRLMTRYPTSQLVSRAQYWTGRCQLLAGSKDAGIESLTLLAQQQPLTYYGLLAAGALAENGVALAAVPDDDEAVPVEDPAEEGGAEAPLASDAPVSPAAPQDEIEPLVEASASYRFHVLRARTLIRLGFHDEAARELTAARNASSGRVHKLELARLALDAEYFHGAMHIARTALGDELESNDPKNEVYRLAYPKAFPRFVTSYADQYKYKPAMLWAIMREESTFRPEVVSPVGAIGLLQIMPYTGQEIADGLGVKGFTAERLYDPEINIGFSAWYVRKLLSRYGGNEALAIGSYNAGPEAMDRWLKQRGDLALDEFVEEIPYTETRRYVKRVLMSYGIYEALYGDGAPKVPGLRAVQRATLVGGDRSASAPRPAPATNATP